MELFDSVFGSSNWSFQEHPVYQALFVSEEYALETLNKQEEMLSSQDAGRCLKKAMRDCSLEVFQRLLEHCRPQECLEEHQITGTTKGYFLLGNGSLLVLAAMLDRPHHARLLLEHGCDCNGADMAIAKQNHGGSFAPAYARFCGTLEGYLQVSSLTSISDIRVCCPTPLAAALLCGSLQTAEVLLQEKGIWKGESSAVCRAAAIVLEGKTRHLLTEEQRANQLEILRKIFCPGLAQLPDRESFLRSVYLQPACYVDFCSTQMLRYQMESGLCTEQDALEVLTILGKDPTVYWEIDVDSSTSGKLLLLKKYFPQLCRMPWATGVFLRETLQRIRENMPYKTTLNAWKQLCGKERDLTWVGDQLWRLKWVDLNRFLQEAGEGGRLLMDADARNSWYNFGQRSLIKLLKTVEFRYRDSAGVSGLMKHLIHLGDLRILETTVKEGLLAHEDPVQLLQCMSVPARQDVRAFILTYARKQPRENQRPEDRQDMRRWSYWCMWENLDEEDVQDSLRALVDQELSREDCLKAMFRLNQYLKQTLFCPDVSLDCAPYPTLSINSLAGMACCAVSGQPLALLQEQLSEALLQPIRLYWDGRFRFLGSPLTVAAFMGRTEQVRLLLEAGVHPDEVGKGNPSRFFVRDKSFSEDAIAVTPLLAAILFGQEETARMLLEAGATCDFSRPEHWQVLLLGSAESLRVAESLSNVGLEKIPAEDLNMLRMMTGEQGERTAFWKELKQEASCC